MQPYFPALVCSVLAATAICSGQIIKRDIGKVYGEFCAACHGANFEGGTAPSMLDDEWGYGGDDESVARSIREGHPTTGMPAFGSVLSAAEIRGLVVLMREKRIGYDRKPPTKAMPTEALNSEVQRFKLEEVAEGLDTPWAMDFLPDGRMLVTEKSGGVRIIEKGRLLPSAIRGTPAVRNSGQGGLLEVAVHPHYAEPGNGWIYLAYSDPAKDAAGREVSLTVLVRGRIKDGAWIDQEMIWQAPLEFYRPGGGVHFGCRIAFDDKGYLYFSHGERGAGENAQDRTRPNGKIHRIHDDGRIPADNPFVAEQGAFASIWTYGNRNPQGLDFDPRTGLLWETEHGPRGGDELNLIRRGLNYGWPIITYGMNYDGTPMVDQTAQAGLEQPVLHWTPSIAVCGIDFYVGDVFPQWKNNLFVTSLAQQQLRRLVIDADKVTHQEIVLRDIGRLRDVVSGPDGFLYLAVNGPDQIVRLVPAK